MNFKVYERVDKLLAPDIVVRYSSRRSRRSSVARFELKLVRGRVDCNRSVESKK